jgi:DNA topoisomerase VI subunit B
MTPEDQQALNEHVQAIAKILYKDADKSQITNLAEIEAMVRSQVQQHVTPELGGFLSQRLQKQRKATTEP